MSGASDLEAFTAHTFLQNNKDDIREKFGVDFWVDLPKANSFTTFFQYLGNKSAALKGLPPKHLKGILEIS